jgi:hypothetical protein
VLARKGKGKERLGKPRLSMFPRTAVLPKALGLYAGEVSYAELIYSHRVSELPLSRKLDSFRDCGWGQSFL